ncbi:hypothetical protein GCM10011506_35670 [Marivirga lumbricoides]|uniref:LysM domain-containing protein n=1 Tax=Marivirga lumbricoides TaxID=1046115 RepID=A0ABQ1MUZ3_9BACT|nr:hypothetical protein GCM10011506_35670 [Marivirga lumbricoides]
MINDATLTKVKIIAYEDSEGNKAKKDGTYEVMINPSSISHSHGITYQIDQPPGVVDANAKFQNISPQNLSFEIILDGTGATGVKKDVDKEIKKLKGVTYDYYGESHETAYVKIMWGSAVNFAGRLTSMDITHTLFAPSGKSLRAKVALKFISTSDLKKQMKEMEKASPDLTHLVTVKIGDTLPLMCERIYKKSHYYLQIARINNLVDFRKLEPGQELIFPPIKK